MGEIQFENKPYIGTIAGSHVLEDEVSKVYFADIAGRGEGSLIWGDDSDSFGEPIHRIKEYLSNSEYSGVPHFMVAFPHLTSYFRWGDPRQDEQETNLYKIGTGKTGELFNNDLMSIGSSTLEVGCPLELFVIGEETKYKSMSKDLDTYLKMTIPKGRYDGSHVISPNMVRKSLLE